MAPTLFQRLASRGVLHPNGEIAPVALANHAHNSTASSSSSQVLAIEDAHSVEEMAPAPSDIRRRRPALDPLPSDVPVDTSTTSGSASGSRSGAKRRNAGAAKKQREAEAKQNSSAAQPAFGLTSKSDLVETSVARDEETCHSATSRISTAAQDERHRLDLLAISNEQASSQEDMLPSDCKVVTAAESSVAIEQSVAPKKRAAARKERQPQKKKQKAQENQSASANLAETVDKDVSNEAKLVTKAAKRPLASTTVAPAECEIVRDKEIVTGDSEARVAAKSAKRPLAPCSSATTVGENPAGDLQQNSKVSEDPAGDSQQSSKDLPPTPVEVQSFGPARLPPEVSHSSVPSNSSASAFLTPSRTRVPAAPRVKVDSTLPRNDKVLLPGKDKAQWQSLLHDLFLGSPTSDASSPGDAKRGSASARSTSGTRVAAPSGCESICNKDNESILDNVAVVEDRDDQYNQAKIEAEGFTSEAVKAEAEQLAPEQAAKDKADRLALELAAKAEAERLAEQEAKAEQERLAKVEAEKLAAEAEAKRLAEEAAAKLEAERSAEAALELAARVEEEKRAQIEAERLAGEATKAETERIASEQAVKEESDRLDSETVRKEEAEKTTKTEADPTTKPENEVAGPPSSSSGWIRCGQLWIRVQQRQIPPTPKSVGVPGSLSSPPPAPGSLSSPPAPPPAPGSLSSPSAPPPAPESLSSPSAPPPAPGSLSSPSAPPPVPESLSSPLALPPASGSLSSPSAPPPAAGSLSTAAPAPPEEAEALLKALPSAPHRQDALSHRAPKKSCRASMGKFARTALSPALKRHRLSASPKPIAPTTPKKERVEQRRASASPQSLSFSSSTEMCTLCCDDVPSSKAVRLRCHHGWYCVQCMERYVEARLDNGTVLQNCPECQLEVAERDLKRIISESLMDRLLTRSLEQAVASTQDLRPCPTPNCLMRVALDPEDSGQFKCPECQQESCLRCGAQPYHKRLTCEKYAERLKKSQTPDSLQQWMEETGAKQCPSCQMGVTKNDLENQNTQISECHKMLCRNCGTRFCFECLSLLTAEYSCGCTIDDHGFVDPFTGKYVRHLKTGRRKDNKRGVRRNVAVGDRADLL